MEQELIHQTEWPLYLSLEQREQLLAGKIARAVAAKTLTATQKSARHGNSQNPTTQAKRGYISINRHN